MNPKAAMGDRADDSADAGTMAGKRREMFGTMDGKIDVSARSIWAAPDVIYSPPPISTTRHTNAMLWLMMYLDTPCLGKSTY